MKIAIRVLLVMVVLATATVIAAKIWIIPGIIRDKVSDALAEYWGGEVKIEDVDFSLSGSAVLHNVKLLDHDGREWLHADNIAITLANWPSAEPVLTNANIDGLDIFAHYINGQCTPPLTESQKPSDDKPKNVDLQSLAITNAWFTKVDDGKPQSSEAFSLELVRTSDNYNLKFLQPGQKITINGEITPNSLENFALKNFTVSTEHGELISKLSALITTTEKADQRIIEVRNLHGKTPERGSLQGSAKLSLKPGEKPDLTGRLEVLGVDLPALQKALQGNAEIRSGTATLQMAFRCPEMQLDNTRGVGVLFVDDIDCQNHDMVEGVMEFIGLKNNEKRLADMEAIFTIEGTTVILKEGCHYTSPDAAIEAEPGGTINLMTKQVDVHIYAALISQIRNFFSSIPIKLPILSEGLITGLLQKMFRLHLLGKWDDPAEKLIVEEPAKNLADGTIEFLQKTASSGGQLGGDVLKLFSDLSKGINGNGNKIEKKE